MPLSTGDGLTSTSTLEISTDSKESDEGITTPARLVPLSKVSRESVELVLEFPPEFDDKEKEGGLQRKYFHCFCLSFFLPFVSLTSIKFTEKLVYQ